MAEPADKALAATFFLFLCAMPGSAQHVVSLPAAMADPGVQVESVMEGLDYSEGPAVDPEGNLFFSEEPDLDNGRIWKVTPEGVKSIYKDPSLGSNGLEFDNQGRLHIAMLDSVLRIEPDGRTTVLAATGGTDAKGETLNLARVNDLSVSSTGALFFTNLDGNTLFHRGTDGGIRTWIFNKANGVDWIEDKSILFIGSVSSAGLQKCKVDNAAGEVSGCARFAGPTDGLTVDANGNVYRASWQEGQVFVHDSTGVQLGFIAIDAKEVEGKRFSRGKGGNTSNCHFGGPDGKTLFITGDGGCYQVRLKVAGRLRPGQPASIFAGHRGQVVLPGARARVRFRSGGGRGADLPWAAGMYFLNGPEGVSALDGKRLP